MAPPKMTDELVHHEHMARFPQRWATGPAMGRFLRALRDEKKILANVCPNCGRSQVPPREVCAVCRVAVHDFEEDGKRTGATTDIKYFEIIGDSTSAAAPATGRALTTPVAEVGTPDSFVVNGTFALPYNYFAGRVGSRWLIALRDEQRIYGVRHPRTGKVYVPPRQVDERDFTNLTSDWVEIGPEGMVTGYTIIRYPEPYQPLPVPYGLALVRLDGADTALTHIVREQDFERLSIGVRVRAVFAQNRTASILDIAWFEPV